jgi:adenine-specific DNA-methyltransferase
MCFCIKDGVLVDPPYNTGHDFGENGIGRQKLKRFLTEQLIARFDIDITTKVVEEIAKLKPVYAVFRDASFADDSAAANFKELFKTYSPDTVRIR